MTSQGAGAALATVWLALLAGCGAGGDDGGKGALALDLARLGAQTRPAAGERGPGVRIEHEGEETWLVARIAPQDWTADDAPGRFHGTLPVLAVGSAGAGAPSYRLLLGGAALRYEPDADALGAHPGSFATRVAQGLRLELALAPGEVPAEGELWAVLAASARSDGQERVLGRRLSGAGLTVFPGEPRTLALAIPPHARLRFATAVEPLLGARTERTAAHTFRVRLDGALLLETRLEVGVLGEGIAWHAVELPRGGVQKARLELEVEGPLALCSFLGPVLVPAQPAPGARRDLVVFLADTFRADNLGAYGNALGLTPEIDAFARSARVYAQAWSTSTHTLPTHASMFSGVYPRQNGAVDFANPLPEEVVTVAERLAALGYRTGAITDGVIVSRAHGLAQGFELFDERRETPTLERVRAFLDADDGRPLFLFVQSYAVHSPYSMRAQTRARWSGTLALERGWDELYAAVRALPPQPEAPPVEPATEDLARHLHDLYLGGVADLDALFGEFRRELERRGLLAHAALLFASDHGEAFYEHGRPFHTNSVFEEELRIPLILAAPGLASGREERPVSLVDFAPTLLDLAGAPIPAELTGRSLREPEAGRVLYAFQVRPEPGPSTLAVLDGTRKLIAYEDLAELRAGHLRAAFELGRDPHEREDVRGRADWPDALLEAQRERLETLLTPLYRAEARSLGGDELQALRHMGYAGD